MTTRLFKTAVTCTLSLLSLAGLHAASVNWGAADTNFVGDASGTPLAVGDLVEIGSFGSLTPSQISTDSLSTLESNFINFSLVARHIGDGSPVSGNPTPTSADAGTWNDSDINSTTALGISGNAIYYWVFNGSTIGTSTQEGVFTAAFAGSASTQANWHFPNDLDITPPTTTDLSDVPTSGILIGSYGTGSYLGGELYNLAPITPVPEPSAGTSALLIGLGLFGVSLFLKRGRTKAA